MENSTALVFVTPNWHPAGAGRVYDHHHIGVFYTTVSGQWAIFNQDFTTLP
jgi:hypothetical protein